MRCPDGDSEQIIARDDWRSSVGKRLTKRPPAKAGGFAPGAED